MVVSEAKLEGGWLCLKVQPADALKWLFRFTPDKDYEIKRVYKKRSLDANAYFWVLLDSLAAVLGIPKTELYRQRIKEIGGVSDTVCVPNRAVKRLVSIWEDKGLGWSAETFPSKIDGCTNVTLYYGSSTFDTQQFSRLLESVVTDCQQLGIETKPPEEVASLLKQWESKS